jgi:hypothetical protein
MKPVDVSGIKKRISDRQMNELTTNSKNKNIRDLCRGINELKGATNLEVTQ